jgi:hypothetical protein
MNWYQVRVSNMTALKSCSLKFYWHFIYNLFSRDKDISGNVSKSLYNYFSNALLVVSHEHQELFLSTQQVN